MTLAEKQHGMPFDLDDSYWIGAAPHLPLPEIGPSSITKAELDELAAQRAVALARYEAKLTPAKSASATTVANKREVA